MEQKLGTFTLGEKAMVSDPCYKDGDQVVFVEPGEWAAYVAYNDEGRVTHLIAHHTKFNTYKCLSEGNFRFITDEMNVDSGQMAICDLEHFNPNDDSEYEKYCYATNSEDSGGLIENYAAVSCTGWGDGKYTLFGAYKRYKTNSDRMKVPVYYSLMLEFIPDEDLYDEDWEDYEDYEYKYWED